MSEKLKFYHVTDLHYLSGDSREEKDGRKIIRAAFEQIAADETVPYVFISGDLTQKGDDESHKSVVSLLEKLKRSGKEIFVTYATHDWLFRGDPDASFRRRLREIYNDFGWARAYDKYKTSDSYAAELRGGWRLLALNDDGDGRNFCGYSDDELQWIKKLLDDARSRGDRVVAMTHRPVIPPNPVYPIISRRDMLGGYETTGPFLCENGLQYLFVGHTHMQSAECLRSESGKKLWQVNTASITQYPAVMRLVEETDEGLDVKTVCIDKKYCSFGEQSAFEKLESDFNALLREAFYSAGYDIPRFAQIARGLSVDPAAVLKLRHIIAPAGKALYKLTFRGLGRLFCRPGAVEKSIADKKIRDTFIRIVRNIYRGNEDVSPDSPEYKAITAVVNRLAPSLKKVLRSDAPAEVVSKIIYDAGPDDWNCLLTGGADET